MPQDPVAAMCDKIERDVRDVERDLIEKLSALSSDFVEIVLRRCILPNDINFHLLAAQLQNAVAEADAYLAEPVKIEVQPEYGSVK